MLAVDSSQLAHSIKSQYGSDMDAAGYLRRFFDLELLLPEPNDEAFTRAQFDRFGLSEVFAERSKSSRRPDQDNFAHTISQLFSCMGCSLRDRERAFTLLACALRSTPLHQSLFPDVLAVLIVLKLKAPIFYARIK